MVAGFMILAFSTLGAIALFAWLHSQFEKVSKKVNRLSKEVHATAQD
jgi:CHASE3 domain sensor protein